MTIREGGSQSVNVYTAGDNSLMRVPKGVMVASPLSRKPICYADMSECSTIAGRDDQYMYFAHLFFSDKEQGEAVVDFMKERRLILLLL